MASCGKPSPFQHVDADFRFVFCASSSGCALDCEQENAYVSPMLPPTDANAPIPHGADRESPVFSKGPYRAMVSPFAQDAYSPDVQTEAPSGMGGRRAPRLSTVLSWKLSYNRSSACVSREASRSSQASGSCELEDGQALPSPMGLSRRSIGEALARTSSKENHMIKGPSDAATKLSHSSNASFSASFSSSFSSRRPSSSVPGASSISHTSRRSSQTSRGSIHISRGSSTSLQDAAGQGYAVPSCQAIHRRSWCDIDATVADHVAHQALSTNTAGQPQGMKALSTLLQKAKGRSEKRQAAAVELGMDAPPRSSGVREALKVFLGEHQATACQRARVQKSGRAALHYKELKANSAVAVTRSLKW
eukprot:CAMPEP_0202366566 /NCGR_PEP_ID=MMETSP1126-20121109/17125_1 /ASSEMBLY_ACC=CAM_ASM_000457 /TAXON_ID=3047 /ORGANISM="Dunaliella tertiolecta, Strain CCMP1320" /LENGTH=362 /DNA_ID=CAMNT_0048961639 /DNA_START=99 /DNA_END=1185 /DNA_ORIENTATION=-